MVGIGGMAHAKKKTEQDHAKNRPEVSRAKKPEPIPVVRKARAAMPTPKIAMNPAETAGSQRLTIAPSPRHLVIKRLPQTINKPMPINTAANPRLNATMRKRPSPTRLREMAPRSTDQGRGARNNSPGNSQRK